MDCLKWSLKEFLKEWLVKTDNNEFARYNCCKTCC